MRIKILNKNFTFRPKFKVAQNLGNCKRLNLLCEMSPKSICGCSYVDILLNSKK
jgi:hypothetical protein